MAVKPAPFEAGYFGCVAIENAVFAAVRLISRQIGALGAKKYYPQGASPLRVIF